MIVDLQRFIASEEPYWSELETILDNLEKHITPPAASHDPLSARNPKLERAERLHYLYERASADLAKVAPFSSENKVRHYLESLVARAYAEIHETRDQNQRFSPKYWLLKTFPQTFRRQFWAFRLALIVTLVGCTLGALAIQLDPDAKEVLLPFSHLQGEASDRVAHEQSAEKDRMQGRRSAFSAQLMTHNTKVSITAMALGMSWGIGTIILLFYNGVILGAVACDYIVSGETLFLIGWLLPHGAFEIPAILIAGQAGLVLARALIGWGTRVSVRTRFRMISNDLTTLIFGVALMLVWAGFVEAFFSQYHEPLLPYWLKISFGVVELILLSWFLSMAGRKGEEVANTTLI